MEEEIKEIIKVPTEEAPVVPKELIEETVIEYWVPKTSLGKAVMAGKIASIDEILESGKRIINNVEKHFKDCQIERFDGITVDHTDLDGDKNIPPQEYWWFNLRASNTEPVLRLIVEAKTKELLDEKLGELKKALAG